MAARANDIVGSIKATGSAYAQMHARSSRKRCRFSVGSPRSSVDRKTSKVELRDAVRRIHATEAGKPYEAMRPGRFHRTCRAPCPREASIAGRGLEMADHLLDHVRPYLDRSPEERIAGIRARRVGSDTTGRRAGARAAEGKLPVSPALRTRGLMLVGPYANGKTMIAERFAVAQLKARVAAGLGGPDAEGAGSLISTRVSCRRFGRRRKKSGYRTQGRTDRSPA